MNDSRHLSLDVLIPTFNRVHPLLRNLKHLEWIIREIKDFNIAIMVSDNASTDNTASELLKFQKEYPTVTLKVFQQNGNVGFSKNLISLISKSKAEYIMFLGDDDYVALEYVTEALEKIYHDKEIDCVLPAFEEIDENGNRLKSGRDLGLKGQVYQAGFNSVLINTKRAHQISGIIVKRDNLSENLRIKSITNLYPQMYVVGYRCLYGKCLHIPEWPVLVTRTNKKAWSYDDVGLLNDIFQNFKALPINDYEKYKLEKDIIKSQSWRAFRYYKNPIKQLKVNAKISFSKNTSIRGKQRLYFLLFIYWLKYLKDAFIYKLCH